MTMNNVATCVPCDPVHIISQQKVNSKHRWTWLIRDFGTIFLPQKSIPGCFEPVWTPKASAAKDHIDFCHAHDSIWADHPPGGQTSVEIWMQQIHMSHGQYSLYGWWSSHP